MEAIVALIGIYIFWWVVSYALRAGAGTVRAASRAVAGKGSFSDNFEAVFKGMPPLEARAKDEPIGGGDKSLFAEQIEVKGLFPIVRRQRVGFVTSVFDDTSGEFEPVMCGLDSFQEPHTLAYQHSLEVGQADAGVGFIGWVRAGVILPQLLETPYGGKRKLVAILRLIDLDNRPDITNGYHQKDHAGLLWQQTISFEYTVEGKGYLELAELRDQARRLCVRIAMAVAMWDGVLRDEDGQLIKRWIAKILSGYSGDRRDTIKNILNSALKEAYGAAKRHDLSLSELTSQLNQTADNVSKYETIELCYEIMATKGQADGDRARIIDLIARALELDMTELERIRDIKIIGATSKLACDVPIEQLLGISSEWDAERIKKHLRAEFQKWNNRLTALPEGQERENAQKMLDAIAEARKTYG